MTAHDAGFSTNDRAEALFGRRPTDVVVFDQPCELGYWCPVCKVPAIVDGDFDQRLHWSEYNGFLWCEVCNIDLPSALCVPLGAEDREWPWVNVGPGDAVTVFLDTVDQAVERHKIGLGEAGDREAPDVDESAPPASSDDSTSPDSPEWAAVDRIETAMRAVMDIAGGNLDHPALDHLERAAQAVVAALEEPHERDEVSA